MVATTPKLAGLPGGETGQRGGGGRFQAGCSLRRRTHLYTYSTATAGPGSLASLVLPEAVHHYLGLEATLSSLSQLVTVMRFVNSLAFPFPICIRAGRRHHQG